MAKIFISSTYSDLIAYRDIVNKSLCKMGHDVIAMEDYVASDNRPVDKCLSDLENCDIYIGIFAWRYGFVPKDENVSITEMEYQHAKKLNIPCLIFLLDNNVQWPPNFMDSHTGEGKAGELINSLRSQLKNEKIVSFFDGKVDLAIETAISVYRYERDTKHQIKPPLWEYLLTVDLLKLGIGEVDKKFSDLRRGLLYRPFKTLNDLDILEWIRQKLDDLVALITLLRVSTTEELPIAWGEPGESGDEEKIRDATTKILNGCRGLLEWEVDLAYTRFPSKFENIKQIMRWWTIEYFQIIKNLNHQIEHIISDPDTEGVFKISLSFEPPKNIDEIVPEVQKILSSGNY